MWSLPSRGRPHHLERFVDAYHRTRATCDVWVRLDSDDPSLADYRELDLPRHWRVDVGPRHPQGCNGSVAEMFARWPEEPTYGLLADDLLPRTPDWDAVLTEAAGLDRLAYGDDLFQRQNLATHPVVGGNLARRIGWLVLPVVEHSYVDTALHIIARETGRLVYCPDVVLEHMHPSAGKAVEDATYRYRQTFAADQDAWQRWMRDELPTVVQRVGRLT